MKQLMIKNRVIGAGRPLVCVPVMERESAAIIKEITYLSQSSADMIEWRVDAFEAFADCNAVREILEDIAPMLGDKIFLYTFRSKPQGGESAIDAATLENLHELAIESGCVDLIDLEYFEEEKPQRKIRQLQKAGIHVITSHHDFHETPKQEIMKMLLEQMCQGGADIVKLAVMPQNTEDVLNLLAVTAAFHEENPDTPVITMSMGKLGSVSRLCGETFGSCVTFGAHEKPSAPGQYEMNQLLGILNAIHESHER